MNQIQELRSLIHTALEKDQYKIVFAPYTSLQMIIVDEMLPVDEAIYKDWVYHITKIDNEDTKTIQQVMI